MRQLATLALVTSCIAGAAYAQRAGSMVPAEMMSGGMAMRGGPAGAEYMQAMMRMQKEMMDAQDPDPARMWAKMMIPHHQGAVDTARITMKYAKDPKIRVITQKTIDAQTKDIAELRVWLGGHGEKRSHP